MKFKGNRNVLINDLLVILTATAIWVVVLVCIDTKFNIAQLTETVHQWGIFRPMDNPAYLQIALCLLILLGLIQKSWSRFNRKGLLEIQTNYKILCTNYMTLKRDYDEYHRKAILHKLNEQNPHNLKTARFEITQRTLNGSLIEDIEQISDFMKDSGLQ